MHQPKAPAQDSVGAWVVERRGVGLYGRSLGDCVARRAFLRRSPTFSSTVPGYAGGHKGPHPTQHHSRPYGPPGLLAVALDNLLK